MKIYINEKDNKIESVIVGLENAALLSLRINLVVVVDEIDEKFQYLDHSLDIDGKKYKHVEFNKKISQIVEKFCDDSLDNGIFGLKIICLNGKEFEYLDKDIPIIFELSLINVRQIENFIKIVPKEFRVQESANDFVLPISKKLLFELNKKFPPKNPFIFEKSPGKCDFKGFEILSAKEKIIYKGDLCAFDKEITKIIKREFYSDAHSLLLHDIESFLKGQIHFFSFENVDEFENFLQKNKNIKSLMIFAYSTDAKTIIDITSMINMLDCDEKIVFSHIAAPNKILLYAKFYA